MDNMLHKNVTDEDRVSLSKPFILKSFCYLSSMFMILIKLGRSEHDQIQCKWNKRWKKTFKNNKIKKEKEFDICWFMYSDKDTIA